VQRQLLQRGAQLRNTPWVYGLVVYTGHETKLLKNAKAAPIKRSNVDVIYNRQIVYMFATLVRPDGSLLGEEKFLPVLQPGPLTLPVSFSNHTTHTR
jgi:hypothetical protein